MAIGVKRLLDTTQFAKDDFQNRNRIKTAGRPGSRCRSTRRSSAQPILDVEICNDRNWRNRCWTLIERSYRPARYFGDYAGFFRELYVREWTRLIDLNLALIEHLAEQFGLPTRLLGGIGSREP